MNFQYKWDFRPVRPLHIVSLLLAGLALMSCRPTDSAEPVATITASATVTITPSTEPSATATMPQSPIPATNTPAPAASRPPEATATPLPTATAIPSPTPELALLTPIESVPAGQPFPLTHNLLFIAGGALKFWDPASGQVDTLLASRGQLVVSDWQASAEQQHLVIAMTGLNDGPGFALYHWQRNDGQLSFLHEEPERYLAALAIAADGQSIGYIDGDASWREDGASQAINVIRTADGQPLWQQPCANQRKLGSTNTFTYFAYCFSLTAAPAGNWVWADIEGVWRGGPGETATQLVSNVFYDDELPLMHRPTSQWSPDGQYLLLQASRFEGSWPQLLNLADGSLRDLPHHVLDLGLSSRWQWLPGNILFALHPPVLEDDQRLATAEWWAVTEQGFTELASLALNLGELWFASDPAAAADGHLAVALNHDQPDLPATRQILLFGAGDSAAHALVYLPPLSPYDSGLDQQLSWLPDGSGLLYLLPGSENSRQPFYIPASGARLYDLAEILGSDLEQVIWLP